jgi:hypothetical protein
MSEINALKQTGGDAVLKSELHSPLPAMSQIPSFRSGLFPSLLNLAVRLAPTGRKYFHQAILFRRQYDYIEDPTVPEGLHWLWAGKDEIEYMNGHPEAVARGAYTRRAARGDMCLCLKRGDHIIAYQWMARQSACLYCGFGPRYQLLFFPLRSDQVFMYDSFTYSNWRRQGYGKVIRKLIYKAIQEQGVRESFALVALDNLPAMAITLALGDEPWCMTYGLRIRDWSRMILGPRPDPSLDRWIEAFKNRVMTTVRRE